MSNNIKPSGSIGFRIVKRAFDIVCSAILMIPVGIVIGVSALFIKAEDQGPVFYMANRTGMFGKTFKMYKLRSMKVNAPDIRLADGSTYNGDDDPRVTKFGKFARKTSIDELPQVINILKGDMTFIGPRPDTPVGSAAYTEEEKIILTVRPGVTGYNQAVNRNAVLTKEKLKNDIYYVKHLSLLFDIKIVFMTIATVLGHKNINRANVDTGDVYVLNEDGTKSENTTEIKQ
ncbi:sugar transferase [Enterococcus faecium]|uniref:sugar transferase n=1 Tax=Enterococcus faecium TaxID=1352 RepID=UPI00295299EA|nr:sugar transferase [Enterococcus faecium]MDV7750682.1 sugar transferase [Enterococcus faecium]